MMPNSYVPQEATLVAGTKTYFKIKDQSPDYKSLPGMTNLGPIGDQGSFVKQTTLEDTTERYTGGMRDTSEKSIIFNVYADDENQQSFIQAAQLGWTVQMKHVFPPSAKGKQMVALYDMAVSGYNIVEPSDGNSIQQFSVSARQSGAAIVQFLPAGATGSISALEVTNGGNFAIADGDYPLLYGKNFITDGQGVGADVTVTVASTAVTAIKSIDNSGLGFNIDDTLIISTIGGVSATEDSILTVTEISG